MGLFSELRLRARHIVGPVLGICAIGYFAFHAIRGERGLLALRSLSHRVELARLEFSSIKAQRMAMENKVQLLHPDSLDPDMLDERARVMLNYGFEDEIIIVPDVDVILTDDTEKEQQ
jgi:cell division protein FtsB